jgi:hypothetical protein
VSLKQTVQTKTSEIYGGINEFKKDYQPVTNFIRDGNDDLCADSHNILNRLKNTLAVIQCI